MDMGITGRHALVCGASKGLGLGCARALAAEGVQLTLVARGAEALQAAADALRTEYGVPVQTVAADITTEPGRAAALAACPAPDILVTNAAGPKTGDFRDWDRDTWIGALDANMLTPIALMRAVVDGMAERGFGRVLNITSAAVKAPIDILGLSNGARSGLTGFVAGLARQPALASRGVTINSLLPGPFETDRLLQTAAQWAQQRGCTVQQVLADRAAANPMRRLGRPDEFGRACAFLCSAHAGYITGQNLVVDGGAYPGTF